MGNEHEEEGFVSQRESPRMVSKRGVVRSGWEREDHRTAILKDFKGYVFKLKTIGYYMRCFMFHYRTLLDSEGCMV